MQIQRIIGENGPLSSVCNKGNCPAAIVTNDGSVFVQGYQLEPNEADVLSAPPGEGFVRMPLATLQKIARQVLDA